jgi:tetratricopeptide (TPR) repeat protein
LSDDVFYRDMPYRKIGFWIAYAVLVALVLLRFLPLVIGTKYLWGVAHLTLLPTGYVLATIALGAVAITLPFFRQSGSVAEEAASRLSFALYESRKRYFYIAGTIITAAVVFYVFRMPTHFLGDGYACIGNLASQTGTFAKWTEAGSVSVAKLIQSALGSKNSLTAEMAYQIMAIASGIVSVWFMLLIAGVMSQDPLDRAITATTLILSSAILLFFGYVESYSCYWAAMTGFFYYALTSLQRRRGLWPALLFLILASFFHLLALTFVPAFAFLVLRHYGLSTIKGKVIHGLVVLVGISAMAYAVWLYSTEQQIRGIFLAFTSSEGTGAAYTVFSFAHLSDIANEWLLVVPSGFLLMALISSSIRRWPADATSLFLAIASIGSLLFLFLAGPMLSMPRDWDLFSSTLFALSLSLLYAVKTVDRNILRRLALSIPLAAVLIVGPFLLVNLNTERSISQIEQIIDNNTDRSFATVSILQRYYQNLGKQRAVDSLETIRQTRWPEFYDLQLAFKMLNAGDLPRALAVFRKLTLDPNSKEYHQFYARFYLAQRSLDSAMIHARGMIKAEPYYDLGYSLLSSVLFLQNKWDSSLIVLRKGMSLNNRSVGILIGMAANHFAIQNYDSVVCYADRVRAIKPDADEPYYYLAKANAALGNRAEGLGFAQTYTSLKRDNRDYQANCRELKEIFPELSGESPSTRK